MYSGQLERVRTSVEAVKSQLRSSELLRGFVSDGSLKCKQVPSCFDVSALTAEPPDPLEWKIIDHCSAVTRLYAIYEQFAHEVISEYLSYLEQTHAFAELPPEFQAAYRYGIAKILEKESPRYDHLVMKDVAREFATAVGGATPYHLIADAMLIHEQNLRFQQLNTLFKNCGIKELPAWLENHPATKEFFARESRMAASVEKELLRLIDYRNDAAHGALTVADVIGFELLAELADFVLLTCQLLAERVQKSVLENGMSKGFSTARGTISEVFLDGLVVVAPLVGDFQNGQTIYLVGDNYCSELSIVNIQLNDVDVSPVSSSEPQELGLKLSAKGRVGARVFSLIPKEAGSPVLLSEPTEAVATSSAPST